MGFICSARQAERRLVATVAGDLDLAAHPRFQAQAEAWARQGTDVVLECSEVTFMDSMGLRVLVELRQAVLDAGHSFALAGPSNPVVRVLALAVVTDLFELTEVEPSGREQEEPAA
jgi:anti-anti-sigma factor